ncbi:MAG: RnfABCDGE type electron transport complex subunit D [Ruminococcus sp.]|nr:RnfABCDGE type electron transport complex subunit D [Ruminococcus sp.]
MADEMTMTAAAEEKAAELKRSAAPYIHDGSSTGVIMSHVLVGLCPALLMGGIIFGGRAMMLVGVCTIAAMLFERVWMLIMHKPSTAADLSAAVTGMTVGLCLPATFPFWGALLGVFISIILVKQLFGGLGKNFLNPALTGAAAVALLFPNYMEWPTPFYDPYEVSTGVTPLMSHSESYRDLFLGKVCGTIGEVSVIALLAGGVYLLAMNVISLHTPLSYAGTVAVFSYFAGEDPLYQVLAGSVIIGAIFFANDYVTTPTRWQGKLLFGAGCGALTCVFRFYTELGEGTFYAILAMNLLYAVGSRVLAGRGISPSRG